MSPESSGASNWDSILAAEVKKLDTEETEGPGGTVQNEVEAAQPEEQTAAEQEELTEEEALPTADPAPRPQRNPFLGIRPGRGGGYEFRARHSTPFPEVATQEGESDIEAAFRVGAERRQAGLEEFGNGSSVVASQAAVDAWGQGLLALHRCRNLSNQKMAVEAVEGITDATSNDPSEKEIDALELVLRLNISQALLKLRQWEYAAAHCEAALEIDPQNRKALWRKAKAVWSLRCPGEARQALDAFMQVDPDNPAARAMLMEIQAEEAKKKAKRVGPAAAAAAAASERAKRQPAGGKSRATQQREQGAACSEAEELHSLKEPAWWCCRRKKKQQ